MKSFSRTDYEAAFERERLNEYQRIDELEKVTGYAIDRAVLEGAARTLACPVKANPPCWQHGRVIYALARQYLVEHKVALFLDIGTAKGFSALCMALASRDAGAEASIVSLDVIDPAARVPRNSVAEVDGLKTLAEFLAEWPAARGIVFLKSTGVDWLKRNAKRVHFAFVDGKHTYETVRDEASRLKSCQRAGDVILFDDVQIAPVAQAIKELSGYDIEWVHAKPERGYAVAVRQ